MYNKLNGIPKIRLRHDIEQNRHLKILAIAKTYPQLIEPYDKTLSFEFRPSAMVNLKADLGSN
jgi:hypothetical protein